MPPALAGPNCLPARRSSTISESAPRLNPTPKLPGRKREEPGSHFSGKQSDGPARFRNRPSVFVFFAFFRGQLRFSGWTRPLFTFQPYGLAGLPANSPGQKLRCAPSPDKSQTSGRDPEPKACSAGFQPAVSQIFNLRPPPTSDGLPNKIRRYSRLKTCATSFRDPIGQRDL